MLSRVKMPKLAETTDVVVVERWLVEVGDEIEAGDGLASVETDKVTVEVPSPVSGRIVELLVEADDEVRTGDPICTIASGGDTA